MQQSDSGDSYTDPFNVQEEIRCGDSLLYAMQFSNGTGPTDITGFNFIYTVKNSRDDLDVDAVLQTKYAAPAGIDSQGGQLAFEAITPDQGSVVPPANYVFDLRYKTPANQVATLSEGTINFKQPVGRLLT